MEKAALMAISPLDGRYHHQLNELRPIFSEYGLIKFRLIIEVKWLLFLTEPNKAIGFISLSTHSRKILTNLIEEFSEDCAMRIKHIEKSINHDVKAVEYFIKERIANNDELKNCCELIHIGCTSEDINNLAYSLMLQTARKQCLLPTLGNILMHLKKLAHEFAELPMLARTHGQAATPTTVGKEFANIYIRLQKQYNQLLKLPMHGKLNGATGNYNALKFAYPENDWESLSEQFVTSLDLTFNAYTTQIEPHDFISELATLLARINTILIDFARDIWGYIAINYFKQKSFAHEVGSSTMPHKVNPIDFENAEGNLGMANALLLHMAEKLPISRWQRDLSDSTVLRNLGTACGHSLIAYQAMIKGLTKLEPNADVLSHDLNQHWEVIGEAIQTMMRRYQIPEPYEKLKAFTRGKNITKAMLHEFIQSLNLPESAKLALQALTPHSYLGYASNLAKKVK